MQGLCLDDKQIDKQLLNNDYLGRLTIQIKHYAEDLARLPFLPKALHCLPAAHKNPQNLTEL